MNSCSAAPCKGVVSVTKSPAHNTRGSCHFKFHFLIPCLTFLTLYTPTDFLLLSVFLSLCQHFFLYFICQCKCHLHCHSVEIKTMYSLCVCVCVDTHVWCISNTGLMDYMMWIQFSVQNLHFARGITCIFFYNSAFYFEASFCWSSGHSIVSQFVPTLCPSPGLCQSV